MSNHDKGDLFRGSLGLVHQGLTQALLLARLLGSGLGTATVQPALPILLVGWALGAAAHAQNLTITSISITSTPEADQSYEPGEKITIQVQLSFGSTSIGIDPRPNLSLTIGSNTRTAAAASDFFDTAFGRGPRLNFEYEVQASDKDTNGISIPANPINKGGTGNLSNVNVNYAGLTDQSGHKVNAVAGVKLSTTALTVTEGASETYSVKLRSAPSANVTLAIARDSGGDADLSVNPASLTFTPGNWSTGQTVTVSAAEDTDRTDGNATFTHTASSTDTSFNGLTASVVVTEDDGDGGLRIAPVAGNGVTVPSSDAQRGEIVEDAASGEVTLAVTLSESSTEVVTVAYATADFSSTDTAVSSTSIDPATAGADYTAASGTLTFAAGETRKTITVAINDDVNRERDEIFKVGLSSATGGATIASTRSEATILIEDDDPFPKATITASVPGLTSIGAPSETLTAPEGFLSVAEGDSGNTDIIFTVTLEGTDYEETIFLISNSKTLRELGSATLNEDYIRERSVTIAAGQTTDTLTLSVVGDENYEPDETVFLRFFSYNLKSVITNSADRIFLVEVTITNDDAVMATSASNLQARPAGSGKLAVSWDPAFGAPNGYSVRWRKASESDTALSAVNTVTATSYTITGLDNDTSYHVRLDTRNLANDGIASNTSLTTDATPTAGAAPTVTAITDKNAQVGQPFEVDVDATPGTAGDSLQYQAASSAPAVATVTPTALTAHSASSKVRVTPVAAGTAIITVTVSDGTEVGTETFDVTVSAVTLGYTAAPTTLTVRTPITALTATATGFGSATVTYSVTTGTLPAGLTISATTGAITGTPTAASTSTATVTVTATAGTGMDTQTATADITFPAVGKGTLAKPTNLALKANSNTRTGFTVTWDAVPNAAGYTATAVQGSNSFTGTVSVSSSGPEAEFIGLTANTTYAVTVTATGDANYVMSEASDEFDVTTAANQVPTVGTAIPDQTATVDTAFEYSFPAGTFSDADSDSLTYTAQQTVGTTDSALPPWLTFTASERKLAGTPQSGDTGTLMVKVTASDGMGGSVSDTFDIVVSTALIPSLTYPALPTILRAGVQFATLTPASPDNFAAGSTFTYAVTAGDLPSGLEIDANTGAISGTPDTPKNTRTSVTVTVTGTTGTGMSQQTETATATLDFPRIFRFRLPAPTVTLAVGSGQLTANWEAVANAGTYALQWKESSVTSWTAATGVTTVDPATPGTVLTGLTNGTTYDVRVRSKAASDSTTHIDGDWPSAVQGVPQADPVFSVTGPATVAEDAGTATFTVTLSAQPAASVTVDYATADGTATAGADYTAARGTLTFTTVNWDTAQTVAVTISNDTVDDDDETFTFTLSNAGTGTVLSSTASSQSTTITDDDTLRLTYTAAPSTLTVDTPITALTATATGFGSVTVTYAVTTGTLPAGLTISATIGTITGTPTAANTSTATVTVTATAGTGMDTQTATADITFPAVGKATLAKPTNLALKANSNTRTGFTVTWDAVPNATGYMATAVQGSNSFMGAVNGTEATFTGLAVSTTYTVSVVAKDNTANYNDSPAGTLRLSTAANQAPTVANMIPDQSATVDTEFSFNVSANTFSDADGDTLTYRATKADDMALPAWLTFNPDARTFSGTPTSTDIGTLMVKVTVSDGNGGSISDTFNIMVSTTTANQAPTVANMIPDQSATVDTEFSFNVPANTFSDADGDTLTYRATKADDMALPAWLTFNPDARTFSGTPTSTDIGTLMVKVIASDGNGGSISDTFNIMVSTTTANQAPTVVNIIPDQSATVDTEFSFNVPANTFSDADGDILTYRATKADDMALPAWLTFNPDARIFSGTPTSTDIGTLMVKVIASDGNGGSISDTFNIMVSTTTANQAPTVTNMIPDQSATVDTGFSFTVPANTFSDADGDTLTYRATKADDMALPAWLTFKPDARTFSGTPASTDIGTLMVKVIASDGMGGSISDTFNIMVSTTAANQAPTVANMIPDQSATVDTVFSFTVPANTFSDADGDTLTYRATKANDMALPAWLTFNPDARTFSGTPTSTDIGTLMVKVTVSDGNGGSISDTFNIMVSTTTANQAPTVVNMIPDQSATVDTEFSFNVPANTFSDADGDTLTYRATKADDMALPAWLTFNPDARIFSGTPTSTDIGTLMVKVTASDGNGGSISDTFNIMVSTTTANQAPTVANMIPDQSATVDTVFSFTVPANTFSDVDGDTLTYRATKADDMALPAWLTFNTDARTFSGTPTSTDTGTLMVKVTVSDGNGGSISDTFNIMVSTTTANQEMKEKLEGVNEEITPSIVNEVVGRQMASITDRFATISSGFHMDSLSMEEVVTDVADYLFSHHQDIQANGFDWRQALSGHNFSFALADTSVSQGSMDDGEPSSSGSGPVSFWGGIDYSSLEDRIEPFSLDGDITSFNFGVDKEFTSDLVAGVLLSIANSEFELAEDSTDSTYEVDIFTVNPYISWEASDELSLWASVGYGRGHTDLTDDSTNDTFSQGGNFIRFSAGGRFQLWSSEAGTALALKLDGTTAHFLGADVQNSRLATELSHDFSMDSDVLNTALELGLLMSSVDTSAAELVGRLHWQDDAGFSASAQSRVLLGGGDRQEWGIGGALRYTTAAEGEREGEGLVVSLEPSFGISNPQLLSELWSATRLDLAVTREAPTAQLNVKLAYGFPTNAGLLTPYTDFSFSETTNTYVTGLRYGLPTGWNLNLKGMHKTSTTDAENTILLELRSDL